MYLLKSWKHGLASTLLWSPTHTHPHPPTHLSKSWKHGLASTLLWSPTHTHPHTPTHLSKSWKHGLASTLLWSPTHTHPHTPTHLSKSWKHGLASTLLWSPTHTHPHTCQSPGSMVWLVPSSDQLYPSAVTWQSPVAPDLEMSWHVWCPPYTRVAAHVSPTLCTRNRRRMSIWPYHIKYWSMQGWKMHEFWTLFERYLSKPYRGPKSKKTNYGPHEITLHA